MEIFASSASASNSIALAPAKLPAVNFAQNEGSMGHTRQRQPTLVLNEVRDAEEAKERRAQDIEEFLQFSRRCIGDI